MTFSKGSEPNLQGLSLTANEAYLLEALLDAKLRKKHFLDFCAAIIPEFKRNWHHELICSRLERLKNETDARVMIFAPPRHTKSEIVSRCLPLWYMGHHPDEFVVTATYGDELSKSFSQELQRRAELDAVKVTFPSLRIPSTSGEGDRYRSSESFELLNRRGTYRATSIGGSLTGFGMHLGIIDDPIKNADQALSPAYRERAWQWYLTTWKTRYQAGANALLMMTRWHLDDLAGRVLDAEEHENWEVIRLPAIADDDLHPEDPRKEGEALWPEQKTVEELEKIRKTNSESFEAMYQGRPVPGGGSIFQKQWFKTYDSIPAHSKNLISVDATFSKSDTSDFVSIQVWAQHQNNFFLVDNLTKRMTFTETLSALQNLWGRYQPTATLIEKKANGDALIDMLKSKILGLVPVNPTESKVSRATAILPLFEGGNVLLPPDSVPWVANFKSELLTFPKGKHDDQVDAMSQALAYMRRFQSSFLSDLLAR